MRICAATERKSAQITTSHAIVPNPQDAVHRALRGTNPTEQSGGKSDNGRTDVGRGTPVRGIHTWERWAGRALDKYNKIDKSARSSLIWKLLADRIIEQQSNFDAESLTSLATKAAVAVVKAPSYFGLWLSLAAARSGNDA